MKIYLMRHGITVWNEKGLVQGDCRTRLSKAGKIEVEKCAIKNIDKKIDIIFCSTRFRAVQTANIMNRYLKTKIVKDCRLVEQEKGVLVGRKKDLITDAEKNEFYANQRKYGIEPLIDAYLRIKAFVDEIKECYKNKTILIITHAFVVDMIQKIANFGEYDENLFKIEITSPNAVVIECEI